jgi:hypothetical protein
MGLQRNLGREVRLTDFKLEFERGGGEIFVVTVLAVFFALSVIFILATLG